MTNSTALLGALADDFGDELVGLTEFTRLLGLNNARESQLRALRNRDPRFPPAVNEGERSIVHRLGELIAWLATSPPTFQAQIDPHPMAVATWRLERSIEIAGHGGDRSNARRWVLHEALALLGHDGGETPSERPPNAAQLSTEVRGLLEVDPATFVRCLDDVLVETAVDRASRPSRADRSLAWLVALALDASGTNTVYEPTCGEGEMLLSCAQLATETGSAVPLVVGTDWDETTAAIAADRLALAGVAFDVSTEPPSGRTFDRVIIDPGPLPKTSVPDRLGQWLAWLADDGRAVLAVASRWVNHDLVTQIPPSLVVLVPRPLSHVPGDSMVLWVTDRSSTSDTCRIVDVTSRSIGPGDLRQLVEAVGFARPARAARSPLVRDRLEGLLSNGVVTVEVSRAELIDYLQGAPTSGVGGGLPDAVVADNQVWGVQLATELSRLIAAPSTETLDPLHGAPADSPDGVLAHLASDEARRVVRRLINVLAGEETRGRPKTGSR